MPDLFNHQPEASLVASLAFDSPLDQLFDYRVPPELADSLQVGQRVQAPFGRANRPKIGFCLELSERTPQRPLKTISKIIDPKPLISDELLELAHWISSYYCCPLGTVLAAMLPGPVKQQPTIKSPRLYSLTKTGQAALDPAASTIKLGPRQLAVLQTLLSSTDAKPSPLPAQLLRQRAQASAQTLRTLIQKNLIRQLTPAQAQDYLANTPEVPSQKLSQPDWQPNAQQLQALRSLDPVLADPHFSVHLLHGVTGSGKTEIYIRCVEQLIRRDRQTIVLVPEIALTTQTLQRFSSRLPGVCVLHSGLTSSQRRLQWQRIASGQGRVVIGPRSAIFAPTAKLGLIIVDEEHEPSYKQDTQPRYHGRDVAIKRAHLLNIPIILGSATPSLESLYNSQNLPHFSRIRLTQRVNDLPMPEVQVVDLRQEYRDRKGLHILSRALESQLSRILERGQQAILLLNRRGYAGFISCASCNYVLSCEHCDVTLTCHKRTGPGASSRALCHYCLSESRIPAACPTCGKRLSFLGSGTQRAELELARKFPQARIVRVDSDTMTRHKYQDILQQFGQGELDILLGTQMIAKGLDFPNVHLVGILSADTSLSIPDFRSSERTFQLAAQVAGRAGRATPGACVVLQTFNPHFPAIHFATTHDYDSFAESELALRKSLNYPPFGRMARIILRAPSLDVLQHQARRAADILARAIAHTAKPVNTLGPLPPPIARISGHHRLHFILRSSTAAALHAVLTRARSELFKLPVHLAIDMDPVNLL